MSQAPAPVAPVLIAGSTGLIGGALGRRLTEGGTPVRALLRPGQNAALLPFEPQEVRYGELLDTTAVDAAATGVSALLYFASTTVPATSRGDPGLEFSLTLPALNNVLRALAQQGPGARFVYPSSGGTVYGPMEETATEAFPLTPTSGYGLGKVMAEASVAFYGRVHGLQYDIVRLANVFGSAAPRRAPQGLIDIALDDALAGRTTVVWGGLEPERDYLFVDDAVDAFAALLAWADRPSDVYNLGSSRTYSIGEVLDVVAKVTGGAHSYRVDRSRESGLRRSALDSSKIETMLDWRPRWSLEDAVAETWRRKLAAQPRSQV